jgi:type II secretory pathway pseudopilin PulG
MVTGFISKYLTYIKLALVVAALGATAYVVWGVRGSMAEADKAKAVAAAVKDAQAAIDAERSLRSEYQARVDKQVQDLTASISKMRGEFSSLRKSLAEDIKDNPDPYSIPVPPKGYEAWMKARERARAASQP